MLMAHLAVTTHGIVHMQPPCAHHHMCLMNAWQDSVDVGDIVGARGSVKRTDKGELSVVTTGLQASTYIPMLICVDSLPENVICRHV